MSDKDFEELESVNNLVTKLTPHNVQDLLNIPYAIAENRKQPGRFSIFLEGRFPRIPTSTVPPGIKQHP